VRIEIDVLEVVVPRILVVEIGLTPVVSTSHATSTIPEARVLAVVNALTKLVCDGSDRIVVRVSNSRTLELVVIGLTLEVLEARVLLVSTSHASSRVDVRVVVN
jgi:hypothetical protein